MNLSDNNKKTVLRTIRISKELDKLLEKDAKAHGSTVNALISSIMKKYAEWDRYTKMFPHLVIPARFFRSLIDLTDEGALATLAERSSVELTNQVLLFWFKKVNLENSLKLLSIESEYAGIGEVEIETEGRDYAITVYHEYGKKYSTFFAHFTDIMMRTCLKIVPQFEITENTVTYRFQAP